MSGSESEGASSNWPSIDVLEEEMIRIRARRGRQRSPLPQSAPGLGAPEPLAEDNASGTNSRIALYTSADQVLSSLSNAFLLFAVAQSASVSQFGVVAVLVAVVTTCMCFNRGALGAPLLLASNLRIGQIRAEAGYAITWAAISGLVAAFPLCLVGMATDQIAVAIALAAPVPAILVQDVLRYTAISLRRPLLAVLSDGFWALIIFSVFVANTLGAEIPIQYAIIVWGAAGLVAAAILVATLNIRPRLERLVGWWRAYARARINFGLVEALAPAYLAVALLVISAITDSAVAGSLRGASTLLGPISLLLSALPLIFVPHARRSVTSTSDQWKILVKTSWITASLTLLAAAALCFVPSGVGTTMMGTTWNTAVAVLPYEGVALAGNCWMASLLALFQAQGRSRIAFRLRLIQAGVQLLVCAVVASTVGTAVSIAACIAVSIWTIVIVGVVHARGVVRSSAA